MKCYYHRADDAVAVCKSCLKALCPQCAVDLRKGIACRDRCEEDVRQLITVIDTSIRYSPASRSLVGAARRTGMLSAGFIVVMGAVFFWWGVANDGAFAFATILGGGFVLYGLLQFARMFQLSSPKKE